jgi:hypothetical protein
MCPGAQHQVTRVSVVRPVSQVGRTARCVCGGRATPYGPVMVYNAESSRHVRCERRLVGTATQYALIMRS